MSFIGFIVLDRAGLQCTVQALSSEQADEAIYRKSSEIEDEFNVDGISSIPSSVR